MGFFATAAAVAVRPQESLRLKWKVERGEFQPDMKEENGAARELEWKKPLGRGDRWILRVRSTYQEEQGMGEGTPGLSAGGQEELCGCVIGGES